MIRINLLGVPRKAKGRRAASTVAVPGEGSSTVVLALFVVAGLVVAVALSYLWVKKETERLNIEYARAEAENHRLSDVKAKYEASKRKADQFERRVKVIDELKEAQKGPVNMLNLVADTVNRTDAVWLEAMTSDGKAINFTGMALSADAVADLMANLRKTNAFKTVEIKETSQDPQIKELQAFKFELICEIALSNKVQAKS
ncbi:MAG TPA: PilN domain-containing protein [Candidatus Angelobacter sp.]|jgi:Tfp pilus assembly protein PilN|nr:PilN domain-containing protein [Candidatus Angelobacter sp.]